MTTEQQIKDAARTLFLTKGYAATTTRDIAGASGTNVALISYYFRSKENLFAEIMIEQMQSFASALDHVVNDDTTDLRTKLSHVANAYIDLFTERPDLPLFVLSELRRDPKALVKKVGVADKLKNSVLFAQIRDAIKRGEIAEVHPVHVFMNLLSLVVFPFIAKPLIMGATGVNDQAFRAMMDERRSLVPQWIDAMFRSR